MTSVANPYTAQRGLIARIDAMEHEDSAVFSDGGESLSGDSDGGVDESIDVDEPSSTGPEVSISSHLAFLAGVIPTYPAAGVAPAGQSADDEEDEYVPDPTGTADAAKFGAGVPTERVKVNITELQQGLSVAQAEAAALEEEKKARAAAVDDEDAEFSDGDDEESDEDMVDEEDDSGPTEDHLKFLAEGVADVSMDADDDDDDEYIP